MAYAEVKQIKAFLDQHTVRDIAITIMNIEQNNNDTLTEALYDKYNEQYDDYFENHDELTGILNEVLQEEDF